MKYSIITPTYRRPETLARAIDSVRAQTYHDWEMIIINDDPRDTAPRDIVASYNDSRLVYYAQDKNTGVNAARNRGLDALSTHSEWVIFLDDDDWLAPDALARYNDLHSDNDRQAWFVTNRAYKDGTSLTHAPLTDTHCSYAWSYLIRKHITGDATHCIRTSVIKNIRFSTSVKQGEEWFFFFQVSLVSKMFYHDYNSTITDGYHADGLNDRKRDRHEQLRTVYALLHEGFNRGIALHPFFMLYITIRIIRAYIK